ncbi:MAG TPA: hypothetical protein VFU15_01240 [Bacteroidia bacterium]|nr:hypothetical protein [Bacteroidia bacterium]
MEDLNNTDLWALAVRRKWMLLAIAFLGSVLGFVFSGSTFIRPKYKSVAVVYPVNIIPYSLESPTEQLLQLFNSADVRAMMVKKYDLAKRYGIDTTMSSGKTRLFNEYDDNVNIRKTEFESIKIDICDENPEVACDMVNGLIHFTDVKARNLQRQKTREVVKIFRDQLDFKQHQLDSLDRIMDQLRVRYGLLDYAAQTKELTKNYLKMVSSGTPADRLRPVDTLMRNLEEKGGDLISVSNQVSSLQDSYNSIKSDYDKALSDLTKELTYSNVVTRPFPADSKSYPVRSLVALISAISSLMLGMIFFAFLDNKSRRQDAPNSGK